MCMYYYYVDDEDNRCVSDGEDGICFVKRNAIIVVGSTVSTVIATRVLAFSQMAHFQLARLVGQ